MSIRERAEDAHFLYQPKRHQGALLSMLVAVAATSRKRRPRDKFTDHDSFTDFIKDEMLVISGGAVQDWNVAFRGDTMRLGEFFCTFLRNKLAHEAKPPNDVRFTKYEPERIVVNISDEYFELSHSWLDGLYRAVRFAPENAADFRDDCDLPTDVLKWFMFGKRRENAQVVDYWRQREKFADAWARRCRGIDT